VTSTVSYAITSVPPETYTASQWLQIWRNHWGIENRCFYVRDVTLHEDASRLRTGEAARNMATVRNAALGLLRGLGLGRSGGTDC
jgi:predicted transposase YbfD/YdcC